MIGISYAYGEVPSIFESRAAYTARDSRIGFSVGLKAAERPILGLRTVYIILLKFS
jgi:hypothetical protein